MPQHSPASRDLRRAPDLLTGTVRLTLAPPARAGEPYQGKCGAGLVVGVGARPSGSQAICVA
jgi:hypothetical protein